MTVQLCLDLMLSCVTECASQSPLVLTVVLHKLANSNSSCSNSRGSNSSSSPVDPCVRLALLQALPALAGDRSCVSLLLRLGGILICV
jgi:hypothetical protein